MTAITAPPPAPPRTDPPATKPGFVKPSVADRHHEIEPRPTCDLSISPVIELLVHESIRHEARDEAVDRIEAELENEVEP